MATNNPFANALINNSVNAVNASIGFKKSSQTANSFARPLVKCTYCNFNGHAKENCFKLIEYPPNWKKKKEIPGVSSGLSRNSGSNTPSTIGQFRSLPKSNQQNVAATITTSADQFTQLQQQINQLNQMMSFFVGNAKGSNSPEDHLAGMVSSTVNLVTNNCSTYAWLIDTGATDHMCYSLSLLTEVKYLANPITLVLPTGDTIAVHKIGNFSIHPKLILYDVFFVPSFNYNLLSVSKWISYSGGNVHFLLIIVSLVNMIPRNCWLLVNLLVVYFIWSSNHSQSQTLFLFI